MNKGTYTWTNLLIKNCLPVDSPKSRFWDRGLVTPGSICRGMGTWDKKEKEIIKGILAELVSAMSNGGSVPMEKSRNKSTPQYYPPTDWEEAGIFILNCLPSSDHMLGEAVRQKITDDCNRTWLAQTEMVNI